MQALMLYLWRESWPINSTMFLLTLQNDHVALRAPLRRTLHLQITCYQLLHWCYPRVHQRRSALRAAAAVRQYPLTLAVGSSNGSLVSLLHALFAAIAAFAAVPSQQFLFSYNA